MGASAENRRLWVSSALSKKRRLTRCLVAQAETTHVLATTSVKAKVKASDIGQIRGVKNEEDLTSADRCTVSGSNCNVMRDKSFWRNLSESKAWHRGQLEALTVP